MAEENMKESAMLRDELLQEAEAISSDMTGWRREFHQFPELAFEENITASRISQVLSTFPGVEVMTGFGVPTSVIGVLRGDLDSPALALRADMDALALEEETGLPFASCIPGVMHASGHDAHMASLLGAALVLSSHAEELRRPIVFLFQPAEEGKGGAKSLVQAGLIEKFKIGNVLGVHLWPRVPYGHLRSKSGIMTALSDRIHITVNGIGGHAANPHMTIDPILISSHLIIAIQNMIAREVNPLDSAVISFGQIEAGYAYNIISEQAHLWGTLRAFDGEVRDYLQERLETLIPLIAKAYRATANVEYVRNYPQVLNDPVLLERIFVSAREFFGEEAVAFLEKPLLSGEDFSFYSDRVPSCFMLLGTGLEYGLHHPKYDIPEQILPLLAAWEAYLAFEL